MKLEHVMPRTRDERLRDERKASAHLLDVVFDKMFKIEAQYGIPYDWTEIGFERRYAVDGKDLSQSQFLQNYYVLPYEMISAKYAIPKTPENMSIIKRVESLVKRYYAHKEHMNQLEQGIVSLKGL